MLTAQQREEFFKRGLTKLEGDFSISTAEYLESRFWRWLEEKQSVLRDDPSTWTEGIVTGISELKQQPEFVDFDTESAISILDQLLGEACWRHPASWHILATFPAADGTWSWNSLFRQLVKVETIQWHTDYEYTMSPLYLAGVQIFGLLADVDSGGGGTLVIEGSPRLIESFVRDRPSESLGNMKRTRLALMDSDPWLREVSLAVSLDRPDSWFAEQQTVIDGVPLAVRELSGKAGDVFYCHPWLLHAPSPNCNVPPRLMCTQRVHAEASHGHG